MTKRIALYLGLLLASCAIPAFAQNLRQLPRATAITGVNDSALVLTSDSASRTRAQSVGELKRTLARGDSLDSLKIKGPFRAHGRAQMLDSLIALNGARFANIIVTSCTGCGGGGATVTDTVRAVTFDSVKATNFWAGNGTAAAPSQSFLNSRGTGLYRFGADTLGFATGGVHSLRISGGASPTITGGAGNMNIVAGTGASRSLVLYVTNGAGTQTQALALTGGASPNITANLQWLASGGNASGPGISFSNRTNLGLYSNGVDTLYTAVGGVRSLSVAGGANTTLLGGAGNMTILAGTGASRTLTLQSTNASSTALTFASGSADTLKAPGKFIASALTAAAGTPNSVCMNSATKEVVENAATSCVVSSIRFKRDIQPLSYAQARTITEKLRPATFTYRDGGRRAIGLIAEQADSVDARLATRDGQGRVNSVNYEQVTIALLAVVQEQQRELDALKQTSAGLSSAELALLLGAGAAGAGAALLRRRKAA